MEAELIIRTTPAQCIQALELILRMHLLMHMKSRKTNLRVKRHSASGFSLLDVLMVVALNIIMAAITPKQKKNSCNIEE
jgi:hypothetical protein